MAGGPPGPSPRSPRPSPRPSLPRPLPPLPLGHPKSRNHRPRVRQWTCRYKDLQRRIGRESAIVRRRRRGAESRLDFRREVLVSLREGLLLLLEGLHPDREGLLVLLELFLQRLAIVLPDEQHPDALVHRRIVLDLAQFLQGPFDLAQLRLELDALAAEDLELVLQLLVLGDLVLKLRGNVLHAFTSWRTRAATPAQRRYELTAARSAPLPSAPIVRGSRPARRGRPAGEDVAASAARPDARRFPADRDRGAPRTRVPPFQALLDFLDPAADSHTVAGAETGDDACLSRATGHGGSQED